MRNIYSWLRWLPAITLMLLLFLSSSQTYQEQTLVPNIEKSTSEQWIADFFGKFSFTYGGHEISVESVGGASFIEFFIRKAAHFFCYALLAALFIFALMGRMPNDKKRSLSGKKLGSLLLYSILLSFLYACSDELHQSLTPGRTAMVQDVLLDTIGATCGGVFTILLIRWRSRRW
ncbi:VanZ family protein [Paenibacillus sp. MSJ-6]|uniref:VanZ family protein n=1 Tax=Paenibacillus brevis TaxID=2841508 RepID=A0ABS6FUF1_9BACL|nr:VanZ family protein [Paenibacillus brevis]